MSVKVFVSHSHADSELAARVSKALRNEGLDVWDPDLNLLPGDNWAAEVARALEESDAMVVLLTPDAINSPWVRIVPLPQEPCAYDELSWTLASMQMVDFTCGFGARCRDLLRIWGVGYGTSAP